MRKLQKTYRMEPAGSQGVWGLDDFQFLPFIWGSSQLIDHPYLEPRHFVDEKAVNENHKDYMFLECILFITEMKTGPFAEHSNQLWNISAVPSWSKVNQGLIRMYKAECLGEVPCDPALSSSGACCPSILSRRARKGLSRRATQATVPVPAFPTPAVAPPHPLPLFVPFDERLFTGVRW
uniref:Serine/threonine-protein phosphatase 2A activator n=1 Tax=Macaca fascicularis TaxID=9541 RepID=I7G8C8_MACFA|nr:unnamed protein product [Macaca fascicularis]